MTDNLNLWARLPYRDPESHLREFRRLEILMSDWELGPKARRLRTGDLKQIRDGRNAALFAHGMATVVGTKVSFADHEAADYDFVTSWVDGDKYRFCPVQLKELRNPS